MSFISKERPVGFISSILDTKSGSRYEETVKSLINYLVHTFQPYYSPKTSYKVQIMVEVFYSVLQIFQIVSIFWYPVKTPHGWDENSSIWRNLRYSNYDNICQENNIYKICFYAEIFAIFFVFFIIMLAWIAKNYIWKISKHLNYFSKAIINIFATTALIPSLKILLIIFKYSAFDNSKVQEYLEENKDKYNFGPLGSILCLFGIALLLLMVFSYELLTADLKHLNTKKNIRARSNSSLNLFWIGFCLIEVIVYVFLDRNHAALYIIFTFILAVVLLIKFSIFLPYYNLTENAIHATKMTAITTCSLAFLLGYWYDDVYEINLISVCLTPFTIILVISILIKKEWSFKFIKNPISSQYKFEHSIRHILSSKICENKEEMIKIFSKYSNNALLRKNGLFLIWVTYFYIDIIKDRRLGMVKLAQIKNFHPNLEAYIQKWRISKEFHEKGFEALKDIEYLQYLRRLSQAKKEDKQLCNSLLDFYVEITNKNTHINKLRHSVKKICSLIKETKKLYGLLTMNNNKHPEPFDLYANLLINILRESSEGNILLKKKHSIKEDLIDDQGHLEECRENVGVIFLSTEENLFGKIAFINSKASAHLKVSALETIGKNFNDFIPSPYSLNHNEKMKNFLILDDRTAIEKPHSLILQDSLGYIFECNILAKLTAFNDKTYFFVSFSPISSNRQSILVSKEGEIYNHSSQLSSLLGFPQESMASMHLHDIINGLELSKMELFIPETVQHNNLDLKFVHIIKKVQFTEIHLILVISDFNEQEMWKNRKSDEQLNFNKNDSAICSISLRNSYDYKEQDLLFSKSSYKSAEEKIQASVSFSQISKSFSLERNLYIEIAYQKNKNTLISIQRFQWSLLLTVLALIATNIGILIYIIENVNDIDLSAVFSNLGNIEYAMASSSNLGYLINYDISEEKSALLSRDLRFLDWTNKQIILARTELIEKIPKWTYCHCSDIATKNIVPIWEFNSAETIRKFNLYDVLSMFIDYGQKLIDDAKRNETHENDSKWLIINGASFAIKYVHQASIDLLECEKNSKSDKNSIINSLFIIGISVCGMCLLILMLFVHFLRLAYEGFWLNLKKAVSTNFKFLENRITERLLTVHGQESTLYTSSNYKTQKLSNYHIKTTLAKRIVFRLSLIIIISLSFYMTMIFVLYKDCQDSMLDRSRLLQNFKFRSISISRLTRYIKEINDNMLAKYFPETYGFENTYVEFYKIIADYNSQYLDLISSKWGYLLSNEIKANLFESSNYTSDVMKYGIISASSSVLIDAMLLTKDYSESEYSNYFINVLSVVSSLITNFNSADIVSKAYIDDQLSLMSLLTFIFSFMLAALSLFYYLPYLKEEKSFVEEACLLLEIVTNSKENIN